MPNNVAVEIRWKYGRAVGIVHPNPQAGVLVVSSLSEGTAAPGASLSSKIASWTSMAEYGWEKILSSETVAVSRHLTCNIYGWHHDASKDL